MQRKEANTNSNNWTLRYTFVLLFIFSTACVAYAQVEMPPDAAPPPLKIISKAEKEQLASAKEVKDRTKLSLALMDARVKIAEQYLPQEQYEMIFRELGGFHAIPVAGDRACFVSLSRLRGRSVERGARRRGRCRRE